MLADLDLRNAVILLEAGNERAAASRHGDHCSGVPCGTQLPGQFVRRCAIGNRAHTNPIHRPAGGFHAGDGRGKTPPPEVRGQFVSRRAGRETAHLHDEAALGRRCRCRRPRDGRGSRHGYGWRCRRLRQRRCRRRRGFNDGRRRRDAGGRRQGCGSWRGCVRDVDLVGAHAGGVGDSRLGDIGRRWGVRAREEFRHEQHRDQDEDDCSGEPLFEMDIQRAEKPATRGA